MKKLYTLLSALIIGGFAFGQTYNFDALTSLSTGTFPNGWVGSPTTGYAWTALAGPSISSGTGPEIDHTLGTALGIFMYVEASTPAAAGDTTNLTSPNMSVSGFTNPVLSFWFHRAGTDMGNMYVDVYNGSSWILGVDSLIGSQQAAVTDPWLNKLVDLSAFSGTIQVRFRAVYGTGWSGDMAIDDVTIIDMPPYDAVLYKIIPSHNYTLIPISQAQTMTFDAVIGNVGGDTITGISVIGNISGIASSVTGSATQLIPDEIDTITLSPSVTPPSTGAYIGDYLISISESDTIPVNDSANFTFDVTDTIMARETGNISTGIGFDAGTGVVGQMFEVFNQDSLSSASFLLASPATAQNVKMKLYSWNSTANTPGALIDSTNNITVALGTSVWTTLQFTCDRILAPGKYFLAVEQIGTLNMGLGYTPEFYEPNSAFYNVGTGWVSLESAGFEVTIAIRMNLGTVVFPSVSLGADTGYCDGGNVVINAPTGWSSYSWSNGGTSASTTVTAADSNFWLQVTDSRGCAVRDTINVAEYPLPLVNLLPTVGICNGASATLVANNDPSFTYVWNNGSTDSSITVSASGLYAVTLTDLNGCSNTGFTSVVSGASPIADIGMDTINYCQGSFISVTAVGSGNIYQWSNGTTGATTQISTPGQVILTVTSPGSCVAYDTAWAVENPNPTVTLSTTTLSFCDNELGSLSVNTVNGAVYLWSTGDTGPNITTNQAGQYWVTTTLNGCSVSDSGMATMLASPLVDLGADTTICDTATIVLDAGTGSVWNWSTGESTQTINVNTAGNYTVAVENSDGCKGGDTITVSLETCVGIFELESNSFTIAAYPNPVSNEVTISLSKELIDSRIQVLDVKGALVYQTTVRNENETINVANWAAGIYSVHVTKGNQVISTKIVVQH